jgi:hypothetical protein
MTLKITLFYIQFVSWEKFRKCIPQNRWIEKPMVPSICAHHELSNEWSCQYVLTILNSLGNSVLPLLVTARSHHPSMKEQKLCSFQRGIFIYIWTGENLKFTGFKWVKIARNSSKLKDENVLIRIHKSSVKLEAFKFHFINHNRDWCKNFNFVSASRDLMNFLDNEAHHELIFE